MENNIELITSLTDLATRAPALYNLVPNVFIDQAEAGYPKYVVTAEMLKNRDVDLILEDPVVTNEGVTIKVNLRGIMNSNGDIVPMQSGRNDLKPGEVWINGFRSRAIAITQANVDSKHITAEQLTQLKQYAELRAQIELEDGPNAFYSKELGHSRKRISLVPANDSAQFQFLIDFDRINPTDNSATIGIAAVGWFDMTLLGTGVNGGEAIAPIVPIAIPNARVLPRRR